MNKHTHTQTYFTDILFVYEFNFVSVHQVAPAEGFSDLAMQVMTSPSKNYILLMITVGVCMLFLVGLLCGRITKRVTQELKDR